jgi:hypothetical protein
VGRPDAKFFVIRGVPILSEEDLNLRLSRSRKEVTDGPHRGSGRGHTQSPFFVDKIVLHIHHKDRRPIHRKLDPLYPRDFRDLHDAHKASNSSEESPAWRKMLRKVPSAISEWHGTITTRFPSSASLTNFTWLPLRATSTKPAASNLRFTSRNGKGLSGTDLDL